MSSAPGTLPAKITIWNRQLLLLSVVINVPKYLSIGDASLGSLAAITVLVDGWYTYLLSWIYGTMVLQHDSNKQHGIKVTLKVVC
jgi:hypothetical protein